MAILLTNKLMPTPIERMTELALQPFYRREGEAHRALHRGDGPANLPTEAQADLRQVAAMLNQPRSSDDALAAYLGRLGLSSGTISPTSAAAKATAAAAHPPSSARPNAAGPSVSRANQSWVMRRFS